MGRSDFWRQLSLVVLVTLAARAEAATPKDARVVVVARPHWASAARQDVAADLLIDVLEVALAHDRQVAVVERRRLDLVLAEERLQLARLGDAATAARIGKLLTADVILAGSLFSADDKVRCVYRVIAVDGGEVLGSVEVERPNDDLEGLSLDLAAKLLRVIGTPLPHVSPESLDDSPVGRLHLLRGIGLYHANNPDAAIASCLQAVQLDPRLHVARLWIARAYLQLDERQHARAELQRLAQVPAADALRAEIAALLTKCSDEVAPADKEGQP